MQGHPLVLQPIALSPKEARHIGCGDLIRQASATRGLFDSGSIQLQFYGHPTSLTARLQVAHTPSSTSLDSIFLKRADFSSSVLQGLWWLLDSQTDVFAALSNTSEQDIDVVAEYYVPGTRLHEERLRMRPRETRFLNLDEVIHRPGAEDGGITISHSGAPGEIIAIGSVQNKSRGFSSNLHFSDPASYRSNRLNGMFLRMGPGSASEGFAPRTSFFPLLVLRNTSFFPMQVIGRVEYTISGNIQSYRLPEIQLASHEVLRLALTSLIPTPSTPIDGAQVILDYSGSPGDLVAEATAFDQTGNLVFDCPLRDNARAANSTGGYPFRLDGDHRSMVQIANVGEREAHFALTLNYPGKSYLFASRRLLPRETASYDLRTIRDNQIPDIHGNVIPFDVTSGQAFWLEQSAPGDLLGRLEVSSISNGLSEVMSCEQCPCWKTLDVTLSPNPIYGLPSTTRTITAEEQRKDVCTNTTQSLGAAVGSWSSTNPSAVSVASGGGSSKTVTFVANGSAQILAQNIIFSNRFLMGGQCSGSESYETRSANAKTQTPTSLGFIQTISSGPMNCASIGQAGSGPERWVRWEVRDQDGQAIQIADLNASDTITIGSPNTCGISGTRTGTYPTDSLGRFPDQYFMCTTACPGTCQTNATQSWTVAGYPVTSKSVVYACTSITIDGQ